MDKENIDFISFKKLLIFGNKSSGKTTLSNLIKGDPFNEKENSTLERNLIL